MYLERVLKEERGKVYLRKNNGSWKKFENVVKSTFEYYRLKFKKRKFKVGGQSGHIGGCFMGRGKDEIWIYEKLPLDEKEEILIHEIIHPHLAGEELKQLPKSFRDNKDLIENLIDEMAEILWSYNNYRSLVRGFLKRGE